MYKASPELSFFLLPSLSAEITGVPHHARCQAIEPLSQGQEALSCVALTTELKALFSLKLVRTDGDNTHTPCANDEKCHEHEGPRADGEECLTRGGCRRGRRPGGDA